MSKQSKYPRLTDGGAVELNAKDNILHFACCDCGLVHRIAFGVDGQEVGIAMERDNRATAQLRRHKFGDLHHPTRKDKFAIIRMPQRICQTCCYESQRKECLDCQGRDKWGMRGIDNV